MNIRNGIENSNLTRSAGTPAEVAASVRSPQSPGVTGGSGVTGSDQARVSTTAAHLAQTLSAGGANTEVRTALVQKVKGALATGTYSVSASQVAGKLMQSMMVNE